MDDRACGEGIEGCILALNAGRAAALGGAADGVAWFPPRDCGGHTPCLTGVMDHVAASGPSFWRSPSGMALLGFLAVALFFLLTEHTAHFLGVLPYVLLLACLLMHLFHHRGHHGRSR